MRHRACVAVLVLVLAIVSTGSRRRPPRHQRTPEVEKVFNAANSHLARGEYSLARALYSKGLSFTPQDNFYDRTSFLIGIGACDIHTRQYQASLNLFAQAEVLAEQADLPEHLLVIAANRAAVYRKMGYLAPALASFDKVRRPLAVHRNPLYVTQAASLLRDIDFNKSIPLFRKAILIATANGDDASAAAAWLQLGTGYAAHDDLGAAERAITEAFRLRLTTGRKRLQSCYYFLGYLRRLQKRPLEAIVLLNRAKELAGSESAHTPLTGVYHQLAKAYLEKGDHKRSLEQFELAVQTARELRMQFLPADAFRTTAEANLQEIFDDYVSAGMDYYSRTGDESIVRRMFEVAEESRVALFEHTLNSRREFPAAYWELLAKYQQSLAVTLSGNAEPVASEAAERMRLQLAEMEVQLGVETGQTDFSHQIFENPLPRTALASVQKKLKDSEALLAFHCGTRQSFVWAVTRKSLEVHRLPAADVLRAEIHRYRKALADRDGARVESGQRVAAILFGNLSGAVLDRPEWVVSPDGPLFEAPVSALPLPGQQDGSLIGSRHSVRILPGGWIRDTRAPGEATTAFVGIGDPVYNSADLRWTDRPERGSSPELPRVPGSGREVRACAAAWRFDKNPSLVTGRSVSGEAVRTLLKTRPAVLHFAGHVVPHPKWPEQVLLALGIQPSGGLDVLGPAEIVSGRLSAGLVTLSGCGSGSGDALPGLGLFGLSRAWLLAGADTVVASYWPIADDSGELLSVMYEDLSSKPTPLTASAVAASLRHAQQRMRQLGGWRADPAYWAAFAVFGKD